MAGAFVVVLLFGASIIIVVVLGGDDALVLRMINIFPPMFASVLALGSGYLIGHAASTHCDCPACTEARYRAAQREAAQPTTTGDD